jgi:SNF2 family DNA or RNA helicase
MTGTPVSNRPLDIWAPFEFLDPDVLGHRTFTSFKGEYAKVLIKPGHQLSGILITGYKNLSRLHDRIAPHSLRVLKKDCLDLPEKIYRSVELEMGAEQASFYNQMKEQSIIELTKLKNKCDCSRKEETDPTVLAHGGHEELCASLRPVVLAAPHILTRTMRLTQLTGGFYPVMDATGHPNNYEFFSENPKADAAMEILEEAFEAEHKCIIWCKFTPEIDMWCKLLSQAKIGMVLLTGNTDTKERTMRIHAFQNLPHSEVAVFLGQIEAGGTGITLTAASKVLYYSNSLSLEARLQSEDRAHRIGQRQDVEYIDFCYHRTVDMAIRKALVEKKEFADIVTGDNIRRAFEGEL